MTSKPGLSPWSAGLRCCCPRCGKGKLFDGLLTLKPKCEVCGLDNSYADAGDGPAVFIILIVGMIITGGALFVQIRFSPPYWVHAALWLPLGIILPLLALRPFKAVLIALQYHHKAAEGRLQ